MKLRFVILNTCCFLIFCQATAEMYFVSVGAEELAQRAAHGLLYLLGFAVLNLQGIALANEKEKTK